MNFFQSEIQIILFLEREWKIIIEELSMEVSCRGLRCPIFSINPEMSCWGRWRGGSYQTLELSSDLVWHHPWYSICEVLKHEMAHQLQEFLYPNAMESSHGPYFHKCCQLLRANPAASGSFPLTDQVVFPPEPGTEEEQSPQQKVISRVHKLLALSRSSNPHEAEAALLKARELMQKYQIENLAESEESEGFFYISLGRPSQRRPYSEHQIANILESFYNVRAIWQFLPADAIGIKFDRILTIYGRATDLKVASYVYDSLHVVIERYWKLHRAKLSSHPSLHAKSDFTYGLLLGFTEALKRQEIAPRTAELMQIRNQGLDDYYHWQNPRIRNRHIGSRSMYVNPSIKAAGLEIGRNLTLPSGLEQESSGSKTKYLS